DHRVPGSPRRRRVVAARRGVRGVGRLHEARLDAELAEPQAGVPAGGDHGSGDERGPLAARVVEQVAGPRALQPAPQPLRGGGGREIDGVLVRRIRPRDGVRGVLLHLARQLAGDLDGPNLALEGTAEGALDEVLELAFEASEDAHTVRGRADPCYGSARETGL